MKVRDLCTRSVRRCRPSTTLAEAGILFAEANCGMLPVVDDEDRLLGVLTDRDVCLALAAVDRPAGSVRADEVMKTHPRTCGLDQDLDAALEEMGRRRVRRLPVVDAAGRLQGVLSTADVVRAARSSLTADAGAPTFDDLARLMRAVSGSRRRAERRRTRPDPFMA